MTVGSQVKTCYASIKNIEATLAILANQTNEASSRDVYRETEAIITEIKKDLEKQVLMLAREEPQYNQ
jgi:DNA-binding ferritin-like protein